MVGPTNRESFERNALDAALSNSAFLNLFVFCPGAVTLPPAIEPRSLDSCYQSLVSLLSNPVTWTHSEEPEGQEPPWLLPTRRFSQVAPRWPSVLVLHGLAAWLVLPYLNNQPLPTLPTKTGLSVEHQTVGDSLSSLLTLRSSRFACTLHKVT